MNNEQPTPPITPIMPDVYPGATVPKNAPNTAPNNAPAAACPKSLALSMQHLTCKDCIDFLMDYLDGTLPDTQRGAFDRHLRLCPPCVAFMDQYKATIALSRACVGGSHRPDHADSQCTMNALPPAPESLIRAILEARNAGPKPPATG